MKLALTLGVAVAAVTLAASATTMSHTVIRHGGGHGVSFDADGDGWLTRAEVATAADQMFAQLDTNNDGRLTSEDHAAREDFRVHVDAPDIHVEIPEIPDMPELDFDLDLEGAVHRYEFEDEHGNRRVIVRRSEDMTAEERAEIEREIERARAEVRRAREEARRGAREAQRAAREVEREAREAAREASRIRTRDVVVVRAGPGDHHAIVAPHPPRAPGAPMFMMAIANSEEADLNGDGAISREEFRAQQLRFFDASDGNGDGRIRFEAPPTPPQPPEAPRPPRPPR